jgi:hypothetical protein
LVGIPVGLGQRRCVADAVTHHGDPFALLLQAAHVVGLLLRQHLGEDALDPQFARHGLGGAPVVAGHHGDRYPGIFEAGDEPRALGGGAI